MKNKISDLEALALNKQFFSIVLEGNEAHIENTENNIKQLKLMLELELMHSQLLRKVSEVVESMIDICKNLEEKEQNLTIH